MKKLLTFILQCISMITRVLPYDLTECACILHLHVYSIQVITLKISIKVI